MIFSKDHKGKKDIITMGASESGLAGKLLVATPTVGESCFAKSVVLLCDHTKNGGMGLIINKHLRNIDQDDLYTKLGLEKPSDPDLKLEVYFGGPVDTTRGFVIHSDEYETKNTIRLVPGIAVTSEHQILKDYLHNNGPKHLALIMGYSGWIGSQLEKEIEENSWIALDATPELVFKTHDDAKWQRAGGSLGIDLNNISPVVGEA